MAIQAYRQARPGARRIPLSLAAALVLAIVCTSVRADDSTAATEPSWLLFSAFGTIGVVHSGEDQADFSNSGLKATGAGYTHEWSADVDTTLGAQLVATVTPGLSATLQIVAEENYDNSYRPHVEWANIKYQFTPEFSMRIGRTLLPSFLFSDTRKVGYANPWVRPPVEAYGLVPVTTSDGLDATYKLRTGEFGHTLVGMLGSFDSNLPPSLGGGKAQVRDLWLLSETIEYGAATLRVTYQQSDTTLPAVNQIFDAMRIFGSQGVALADKYDERHKTVSFIGIGAMYDPGKWFAIAEWGNTEFHSAVGNRTAWYVSGGYRLGKLTPYLNFSSARGNSNRSDPGLDVSQLPPALAGIATGLNAGLNNILNSTPFQRTVAVGARWDVFKNAALKLQYNHLDLGADSAGTLINIQPGFQRGGAVNVVSFSLDFVL